MITNGFKKELTVKYSEVDHNLALKPFALLNFLQDIASEHAESLGFGYSYLYPKNLFWFLIKYHMEFSEYPTGTNNLTLLTNPRGYNRFFVQRDFEFWQNGKNIARIASIWSLVNMNTKELVHAKNVIPDNPRMVQFEKQPDDLEFIKIKPIERVDFSEEFKVRYNDIDVNGHANNGNYIVWAFEPLDFDFRTNHKIKTLDIIYKKEAKCGEKVITNIEQKDNLTTCHVLKNEQGEELCLLECDWV